MPTDVAPNATESLSETRKYFFGKDISIQEIRIPFYGAISAMLCVCVVGVGKQNKDRQSAEPRRRFTTKNSREVEEH
jgi:hypothetical protein